MVWKHSAINSTAYQCQGMNSGPWNVIKIYAQVCIKPRSMSPPSFEPAAV